MELETLVRNFRKAIEAAQANYELGEFFRKFPTGQCGHSSDMLAQYLIDNGIGPITYVNGTYYGDDSEDRWCHAWLVVDGRPGVKSCVSEIRQSQEGMRWKMHSRSAG